MAPERRYTMAFIGLALRDLHDIAAYLERDSVERATAFRARLIDRLQDLETHPSLGRIVPELHARGVDSYRELIIQPYRVVYRITGSRIVVHVVCDSRRHFQDVLLEHLISYEP